jgi:hypothetical protein
LEQLRESLHPGEVRADFSNPPLGPTSMDPIERWKLADELTVYQIALLIAGYDPAEFERDRPHVWPDHVRQDISPYLTAVKNAARSGRLSLTAVKYENSYTSDDINWEESTVSIDRL